MVIRTTKVIRNIFITFCHCAIDSDGNIASGVVIFIHKTKAIRVKLIGVSGMVFGSRDIIKLISVVIAMMAPYGKFVENPQPCV